MNKVYGFIGRIIFGGLIGVYVGNILDNKFNTMPLITIGLLLYAIFGSIYILIKDTK